MPLHQHFLSFLAAGLLLGVNASHAPAQPARISPLILVVNSTSDEVDLTPGDGRCTTSSIIISLWRGPPCTLRAAIMEANAYSGSDIIVFIVDGIFALTISGAGEDNAASGDLDITDSVTIRGNGAKKTIIDGNGTALNDRVFHIDPAGVGHVASIAFVTIQNGRAVPASEGGGILNGVCRATGVSGCDPSTRESRLMMSHSVVRSNSVSGIAFASGGGIANNGYLKLTDSSIEGNTATVSGGFDNGLLARADLDHVLIARNTASLDTRGVPYGAGGGLTNGNTAMMTIANSHITDNYAPMGSGGGLVNQGILDLMDSDISRNDSGYWGGGIFSGGSIDASNSSIAQNTALGGGGIYNTLNSTLVLNRVSISGNQALSVVYGGGGIRNTGMMELTNVTISNNTTDGRGGGISNGNASTSTLIATLTNVTLNDNQAPQGGGIDNPGAAGAIALRNTLVANSPMGGNCTGHLTSNGHNLDSQNSCGFTQATDITNRNPHLYPLEDNGGPTQTHRLGAGFEFSSGPQGPFSPPIWRFGVFVSAAVDAGDNANCPPTDQRGVIRPIANGCDVGAYEFP